MANEKYEITGLVGEPSDYSDKNNWMKIPEITKKVDTFFIYPTVFADSSKSAPYLADINSKKVRAGALYVYEKDASVFENSTNVFAPYYRQSNLAAICNLRDEDLIDFQKNEQRTDIYAALDYYFEHYNCGRPFILAGHSQGSMMLLIILKEYMKANPQLQERLVAAYVVGFSVTKKDLEEIPYMKFAERADDVGVIISWNTEGPENSNSDNLVVRKGAVSINPLNWKRDETYTCLEDNPGSRTDDISLLSSEIVKSRLKEKMNGDYITEKKLLEQVLKRGFAVSHPGIADARLDLERGVVICSSSGIPHSKSIDPEIGDIFGPASFHSGDYGLYYYSIQENVNTRVDAYLDKTKEQ